MSNRAYLAASNSDTIYPSFAQKGYDAPQQLIASDVENLPLLWLALFREGDLRRKTFKVHGDDVPAFAPLCRKQDALKHLDQATPYLVRIFPHLGPLDEYAAMFRSAIAAAPYDFISLEVEEIASLYPPEHRFEEILTLALRGFDQPENIHFHCDDVTLDFSSMQASIDSMDDDEEADEDLLAELKELTSSEAAAGQNLTISGFSAHSHAEILERLSSLRSSERLPLVRMYLDELKYSDDEQWNFTRVLGAGRHGSMGYGREVPWEKEGADYGFTFIPADQMDDEEE